MLLQIDAGSVSAISLGETTNGLVVWVILLANPLVAGIIFGAYGLGRSLPLVAVATARKGSACNLDALLDTWITRISVLRIGTVAALAFIGGFLVA